MRSVQRARPTRVELEERFNPNHEPGGSPEGGRFASGGGEGGGGGSETSEKPSGGGGGKGKVKVDKISDFQKEGIRIDPSTAADPAASKKFIDRWNEKVGEAPEDFKKEFLGLPGTMTIQYADSADKMYIQGQIQIDGKNVGEYSRHIDLKNNKAYSAFFQVKKSEQDKGYGKKLLAANVAMYQKLGLDKVEVSANIDIGGYSWARYGYVPDQSSWNSLRSDIIDKLEQDNTRASHAASGSGYTPDSWDSIVDHDQSQIEAAWMRSTYSEFEDSEIQSWRDSGAALDQAKQNLAGDALLSQADWAKAALQTWREGRDDEGAGIPYSNETILAATTVDYTSDYEGRSDPDITIDVDQLKDEEQPSLPGLEAPPLTDEAQQEIVDALTKAFNDEAEKNVDDIDPPDMSDQISEYQGEYWDGMSDADKFDWAERNGELPEYPLEDEDQPAEVEPIDPSDPVRDAVLKLARSNDPKALWAISDSTLGKQLLIDSSWHGTIDFKDKQTMDRFHAYVAGSKKKAA